MDSETSEPVIEIAPNRLQRQHAARKEAGEDDDWQRADADRVHLGEDIGPVTRARKDVRNGRARQDGILLYRGDVLFYV
jgi:hypothetical protein